jgi:hypothetical protein
MYRPGLDSANTATRALAMSAVGAGSTHSGWLSFPTWKISNRGMLTHIVVSGSESRICLIRYSVRACFKFGVLSPLTACSSKFQQLSNSAAQTRLSKMGQFALGSCHRLVGHVERQRGVYMSKQLTSPSRRFDSRVETPESVYIYWRCFGRDDIGRVRNLCVGGLFIETRKPRPIGADAELNFLVQEGQIRANAVIRYMKPGEGLGMRFTSLRDEDRLRLATLMNRFLRSQRQRSSLITPERVAAV